MRLRASSVNPSTSTTPTHHQFVRHHAPRYYLHAMAAPTLADVMAQLATLVAAVHRVDLQNQQQTALLAALTTGVQIMSQTADQTASTVADLDAKVDTLLSLVQPSIQSLRDQLASAQAQIAALQAGDAADAATLSATISAAQVETAKVQAAIDQLTPPAPTP